MAEYTQSNFKIPVGRDDLTDAELVEALRWIENAAHRTRLAVEAAPSGRWGSRKEQRKHAQRIVLVAKSIYQTSRMRREESPEEQTKRLMAAIFNTKKEA